MAELQGFPEANPAIEFILFVLSEPDPNRDHLANHVLSKDSNSDQKLYLYSLVIWIYTNGNVESEEY